MLKFLLIFLRNFVDISKKIVDIFVPTHVAIKLQKANLSKLIIFKSQLQSHILSVSSTSSGAVRKVDASGSLTWMTSFALNPLIKSLSVDAAEQSVYLASKESPLVMLKLSSSDGSVVSQHQL